MKRNFDRSLKIVLELEGKLSTDQNDPGNAGGGFTVWGLSSKYNPGITKDMSIEQAAVIYRSKYWDNAGCNELPFPFDIVVFDLSVNPIHGGLKAIVGKDFRAWSDQFTWQDLILQRMIMYNKYSNERFKHGHLNRCLKLYQIILDW